MATAQVADVLRAREADSVVLAARSSALDQSRSNYDIAQLRFEAGGISESSLLDAKRDKLRGDLDRSHAEAQRLADTAALFHAMAGPI
jgi:outer membrane protein TolC